MKTLRKYSLIIISTAVAISLVSCGNNSEQLQSKINELQAKLDQYEQEKEGIATDISRSDSNQERGTIMPKYIIEREIPEAGKLSAQELQAISQKSCDVLKQMGPLIQWVESFVTDDKIYCVYIAPNEEAVREHAQKGGFPANRISAVRSIIDPTTAED